ncbi:type II toxin-antitoxin system RelE/ParE family toxin [Pseudomonas huanghezhanensis]
MRHERELLGDGCSGKSGGYRTLLSARLGASYVFLFGFSKSSMASISQSEKKALRYTGKVLLALSADELCTALKSGILEEVHCEQQNH